MFFFDFWIFGSYWIFIFYLKTLIYGWINEIINKFYLEVITKGWLCIESLVTFVTFVFVIARIVVGSNVKSKIWVVSKRFATKLAHMRPLARVYEQVTRQVMPQLEFFTAMFTFKTTTTATTTNTGRSLTTARFWRCCFLFI